jgi:hypothetical protein
METTIQSYEALVSHGLDVLLWVILVCGTQQIVLYRERASLSALGGKTLVRFLGVVAADIQLEQQCPRMY